ncbi:BRO-N domain-containing protein [Tropicimonas marinistellae]|uniref:BRO-N domain-containing protein n=1 Tax=Tropicimonas marinistellae TaxID=1739787 RepID=UPI00082AE6ED|nr:Bro-N domain-containing protein [Tropicimonas marinistellae]
MQYAMQVFQYEDDTDFRVIDRNGEPWFVMREVANKLGIKNPSDISARLDDDEKGVAQIDTPGGKQNVRIINESGLYSAILGSSKPEAKRFKKWITSEVLPSIRKTGSYGGRIPAFIKRFNENWDRVEPGYFSVISELAYRLWGRLEMVGHIMADRAPNGTENRPDVSVGRLFADWLRKYHPDHANRHKFYTHKCGEWEGEARQYPQDMLALYIEFVDTVWIPDHSERYFNTRDPAALPYLPKLLPRPAA